MSNDNPLQNFYNAFHAIPGVADILGLHIWSIAQERNGLIAHISIHHQFISQMVVEEARKIAVEQGIKYTSFQIDARPCRSIWQTIRGEGNCHV